MAFLSVPNIFSLAGPSIPTRCSTPSAYQHSLQLKSSSRLNLPALCTSYEVGAAFLAEEFGAQNGRAENPGPESGNFDSSQYEVILKGGEQVTSVLEEMAKLLEDMKMDEASEEVAVQLAAQGVIGKRVDEMESGFMMALDYMIQTAEKDQDDKVVLLFERKSLLEVIKETVLSHLTKKCPPHVQVIGLLCRTPQKESRHELLRRVAAGGGVFQSENGTKVHLPGANLNDIANQADDILEESNYYLMNRSHIPAFGSWESCNTDEFPIPFTQCFESARQVDLRRYSYSEDRDLYVAGDLYQNDILTPAMIVVPRRKRKTSNEAVGKEGRKEGWVVCNYEYDEVKKAVSPVPPSPSPPKRAAKAVDEDLYKISPQLLYAKPKRKGIRGFFSMCLPPTCAS